MLRKPTLAKLRSTMGPNVGTLFLVTVLIKKLNCGFVINAYVKAFGIMIVPPKW